MATMNASNLYPTAPGKSTQEQRNPAGSGKVLTQMGKPRTDWNVPVLSPVAGAMGLGVPALLVMGVAAWWLFRQYN